VLQRQGDNLRIGSGRACFSFCPCLFLNISLAGANHLSPQAGAARVAEVLLAEGNAFVDSIDSHGATPLHLSLRHLQHATVELLLAAGADATWKDLHGRTPLEVIPPLPPVARSIVNLREAEHLVVERQQRTYVRKLVAAHYKNLGASAVVANAGGGGAATNNPEVGAEGLAASSSGSAPPATHLTTRTFSAANVSVNRAQQRTLTRKSKGEGFLQRANGKAVDLQKL
jgi:hypothetical protein